MTAEKVPAVKVPADQRVRPRKKPRDPAEKVPADNKLCHIDRINFRPDSPVSVFRDRAVFFSGCKRNPVRE